MTTKKYDKCNMLPPVQQGADRLSWIVAVCDIAYMGYMLRCWIKLAKMHQRKLSKENS
jgi:hypothetical protein